MKSVTLPSGKVVPALGQGTWEMGVNSGSRTAEIKSLRKGLDLGLTLIDTAEMYGDGECEKVVGEAIAGRRGEVFLVSKVYPHNASRSGVKDACERSLRRLRTDRVDLYLLHWRGNIPLRETLDGFRDLQESGKIVSFGVSNFDVSDMQELFALNGGETVQTNQVLYNLNRRGIEWDLVPWQREHGVPIMAYSPIDKGRFSSNRKLRTFAKKHDMTPVQVALSWLLQQPDMIVIPKTSNLDRMNENIQAVDYELSGEQLQELDKIFPPPTAAGPLDMT